MKIKFLAVFLGCGLAASSLLGATTKKADKPVYHQPELKLDTTGVAEGKAPVLTSYADVLDGVRPSVVSVYSTKIVREQVPLLYRQMYGDQARGREQKLEGLGSGVIISSDGYILTNNHVVDEADELKVTLNDGREFIAKVVGTDPKTDIAVIKIDAAKLPAVTIADSAKLRVGDVVFAIGNPLGVGQTVTMGIVSATGRQVGILAEVAGYEDFIQTDASINRGNSGGALVDAKGRLVGINSAIVSNNQGSIGIGFAIPVNLIRAVMTSLIETGKVSRGYLGVKANPDPMNPDLAESIKLPRDTKGVLLTEVYPGSPAAKAGIRQEDVITSFNGKPIATFDEIRLLIVQTPPTSKITLGLLRDGKPLTLEVQLEAVTDDDAGGTEFMPGLSVQPLTDELRQQFQIDAQVKSGLVVTEVKEESGWDTVFPEGVVILQVNRQPVTDLAEAKKSLHDGLNIALLYYHGVRRYISFTLH